jgi:ribosome-binding factor A
MSTKEYPRRVRVGVQLQRELTTLIREELTDPRVQGVTLTEVDVSPDLKNARVYVSRLGQDPEPAAQALNHAVGKLRHGLGKRLRLRVVPALQFVADRLPDQADRISRLIRDAVREDDRNRTS